MYGSADGARHVFNSSETMNSIMMQVGKMLNLKEHTVKDVSLYGPADMGNVESCIIMRLIQRVTKERMVDITLLMYLVCFHLHLFITGLELLIVDPLDHRDVMDPYGSDCCDLNSCNDIPCHSPLMRMTDRYCWS